MTLKRIPVQTAENIFKLGIATSEVLEQICPILESILAPFTIFFYVSETMLSANVANDQLVVNNYQWPIRRERDDNGGGLLIYLSHKVLAKRRVDLESSTVETIWIEVAMKGQKFLLCNCYRPPNAGVEFWEVLQCQLDKVKRGNIRNIIIVGDLNADPGTPPGRFLKSFVYQNHMHINVDKPIRITPNSSTCLDQIISNIPFLLQHISIMQPIGGSDHNTVTAEFGFRTEKKLCYERWVWYYNKANFDHFRWNNGTRLGSLLLRRGSRFSLY